MLRYVLATVLPEQNDTGITTALAPFLPFTSARITGLSGPVGDVVPGAQGVGVVGAENPLPVG